MNRILICILSLAALFGTSCSDREPDGANDSTKEEIGFNAYTYRGRGAAVSNASLMTKGSQFTVYAIYNDDSHEAYMDAVPVTFNGTTWQYDNVRYWPSDGKQLNFFAIHPTKWNLVLQTTASEGVEAGDMHLNATYTVPADVASQEDIVIARHIGCNKPSLGTTRQEILFMHTLTKVVFKLRVSNRTLAATIGKITIHNVLTKGDLHIGNTVGDGDNYLARNLSQTHWVNKDEPVSSYSFVPTSVGQYTSDNSSAGVELVPEGGSMILMPQAITGWDHTAYPNPKMEGQNGTYISIEIVLKDKNTGAYLVGNATECRAVYMPLPTGTDWNMNSMVTYTIDLGATGSGGFDEDGNAVLFPIKFTSAAETWISSTGDIPL